MTKTTTHRVGGFKRCPNCKTMQGPVPECPKCGWCIGCGWCKKRIKIPGRGWEIANGNITSDGICLWCAITLLGGTADIIDIAASRLDISPGLLEIKTKRLNIESSFVVLHHNSKTGWAGRLYKPHSKGR